MRQAQEGRFAAGRAVRGAQAGMTLAEVVVALGVLAGVLVSVASLFVLGGQRVKSGREMTEATTIAGDILESLNSTGFNQMTTLFPTCTTTTGCTIRTDVDSYASSQWQSLIAQTLNQGRGEITLTPIGGSASPTTFTSAEGIRIQVRIVWTEGTNTRSFVVETMRF